MQQCHVRGEPALCSTDVATVAEPPAVVEQTGASVPSTGAVITSRVCDEDFYICATTTTTLAWSPDPDGGATQSASVSVCTAPFSSGDCGSPSTLPPMQFALQCGAAATSCSRSVTCTISADQSEADCTLTLAASYAALPPFSQSASAPIQGVLPPTGIGSGGGGSSGGGQGSPPGGSSTSPTSIGRHRAPATRGQPSFGSATGSLPVAAAGTRPAPVATTAATAATATATTLTSSATQSVTGQLVVLTASIVPAPDGGTVSFLANGKAIRGCAAVPVNSSTGLATCRTRFAVAGLAHIQAVYSGDSSFARSASVPLAQKVRWSLRLVGSPSVSAGSVRSEVVCAAHSGGCHTTVRLSVSRLSAGGSLPLGKAAITIAAGKTTTITVALTPQARKLLARLKTLALRQTLYLTVAGRPHPVNAASLVVKP